MSMWIFLGVSACISGIIVYYERESNALAEWADALSEEVADLHRENQALRGRSWQR